METKKELSTEISKLNYLHMTWKYLNEIREKYSFIFNKENKQKIEDLLTYVIIKEMTTKQELLEQIKINGKNFEL